METTLNIIVKGDKILLARKKRGFGAEKINSPGGKLEPGETIEQAMIRETQEEVGITPTVYEYVGVVTYDEYFKGQKTIFDCHLFLTTGWQGEPTESDEMKPMWISKNEIPYAEMFGDDPYWLPQVLAGEKVKCFFKFDKDFKIIEYKVENLIRK